MDFKDLSPELREKALTCKTVEDLVELAEKEGHQLSDEELGAFSGGDEWFCYDYECPDEDIW